MSDETQGQEPTDPQNGETQEPSVETPEMIDKTTFDKVKKESVTRKKKIRDLETQLAGLQNASTQVEEKDQDINNYKKLVAEKDGEIQRLQHLGSIRDKLVSMDVVDPAVAALALSDAAREDVLDSDTELSEFLSNWKENHSSLFKPAAPTATTPKVPSSPEVEVPPGTPTEDSKWEQFKNMSPSERGQLSSRERDEYMKLGAELAGRTFRSN